MKRQADHSRKEQHAVIKQTYDDVQSDGRYEEGMARISSGTTFHWPSPAMVACCGFIPADSRSIGS